MLPRYLPPSLPIRADRRRRGGLPGALSALLLLALLGAAPAAWAQSGTDAPAPDLSQGFAPVEGASGPAAPGAQGGDPFAPIDSGDPGGATDPFAPVDGGTTDGAGFGPPLSADTPAADTSGDSGAERNWRLGGFLRLDSSYNYERQDEGPGDADYRGLNKLRLALQLELTVDLPGRWRFFSSGQVNHDFAYDLKDRANYTDETLDVYGDEAELRELWISGSPLGSLDLKAGRQIVVWGKSDQIRVVDVLNPVDNREPGLTDLEDLRLPVTMARVDYYFGDWALQGVAVPEIRFNKNPVVGSEFYPYPTAVKEEVPSDGGDNTEYGASLSAIFSGWDLGFYWADFYDDNAHVEVTVSPQGMPTFTQVHSRLTMQGVAANVALGAWLLKGEMALFDGLEFANSQDTFQRLDGVVGLEYSGITNTTLSLEAVDRRILDYDPVLENAPDGQLEDVNQYALSYRGSFLREQLDLVAVLFFFGGQAEEGGVHRYSASYELGAGLTAGGGVVIYQAGQGDNLLLESAQDNDRVFADLKYDF